MCRATFASMLVLCVFEGAKRERWWHAITSYPLLIPGCNVHMNHLTSSKNRGLSGMNFSATREAMQGREQTRTKTLQLWKWYLVPILNPQPGNSNIQQVKTLNGEPDFSLLKQLWTLQLCMTWGQVDSLLFLVMMAFRGSIACSADNSKRVHVHYRKWNILAQALPFKNLLSLCLEII